MTDQAPTDETPIVPPKSVIYCQVCTLPPEYCEFGSSKTKCREWLEKEHPELVSVIYNTEAVEAAMQNLSLPAQEKAIKAEASALKRAEKEEAKALTAERKKATSRVILKRTERTKRKHVIIVTGLEAFGLDNKKMAKEFGKKFACGSSVTKNASGGEEIVVQGDLSDDILEYLEEKYEQVPFDNIDQVEEKKKKKSEQPIL